MVSSRPVSPRRTLSYLSEPWPWTRMLRSVCREFGIVGEDRAAVAEAAERLGREEAGRGRKAEGAEPAALVARAESLRGVVEHEQALGLGDRADRVMVGALPEQVDRDHRLRLEAELLRGRDAALQRSRDRC